MAKKIVLDILSSTLGSYFKIDTDDLKVSLFKGEIKLKDVQGNIDGWNAELMESNPNLPFKLDSMCVDSIKLSIPWSSLYSKSVKMEVKGVRFEFCTSSNRSSSSQTSFYKSDWDARRLERNKILCDGIWDARGEGLQPGKETFGERLGKKIIENLKVEISDVSFTLLHKQLPDAPNTRPFSLCFKLDSLNLFSTDSSGNMSFVDEPNESSTCYKKLLLDKLSVSSNVEGKETYIVEPFDLSLSYSGTSASEVATSKTPLDMVYNLNGSIASVRTVLPRELYARVSMFSSHIAKTTPSAPLYPEHRPSSPVIGNAKLWWRYALVSIGRLNRRRSWPTYILFVRRRRRYIEAYKRYRYSTRRKGDYDDIYYRDGVFTLRGDESGILKTVETELVGDMKYTVGLWRNTAEQEGIESMKTVADIANAEAGIKKGRTWSSYFSSSSKSKETSKDAKQGGEDDLAELASAILSDMERQVLGKTVVSVKMELSKFHVTLKEGRKELGKIEVNELRTGHVSDGSTESTATLGRFTVQDGAGEMMIKPSDASEGELIWLKHQIKENGGEMATSIGLGGIEVLCDVDFCKKAVDWFDVEGLKVPAVDYDTDNAIETLPEMLENTMAPGEFDAFYDADDVAGGGGGDFGVRWGVEMGMREAWRSKVGKKITFDISLLMNAPTLVFPHPSNNGSKVVLDMGRFSLTNKETETDTDVVEGIMTKEGVSSNEWEAFALRLTDFSLILHSTSQGHKALLSPATSMINVGVEKKTSNQGVLACAGLIEGLNVSVDVEAWEVLRSILANWEDKFSSSPQTQTSSFDHDFDNMSVASSVREGYRNRHLRAEMALGVEKHQKNEVILVGFFSLPTITLSLTPVFGKSISVSLTGLSSGLRIGGPGATVEGAMGAVKVLWTDNATEHTLMQSGGNSTGKLAIVKVVRNDKLDETDITARFESMEVNYNAERIKEILGCVEKLKMGNRQQITSPTGSPTSKRLNPKRKGSHMDMLGSMTATSMPMVGTGIVSSIVDVRDTKTANKTVIRVNAELGSFTLYLNSVLDDEILFGMKMTSLSVDVTMEGDDELAALTSLGDFQIFTDALNERVYEGWRNIFGTSPSVDGGSSLLLKVAFYKGRKNRKKYVLGSSDSNSLLDKKDLEVLGAKDFGEFNECGTFCDVEFGEITVSFLQAQILALVDYLQGGVLGVLFPTDPANADDLESSKDGNTGEGLFKIRSSTVRLVLPVSPSSAESLELNFEGLHVLHHILPDEAGGKMRGLLGDVMFINNAQKNMCKERVSILLDVTVPPPMAKKRTAVIKVGIRDMNLLLTHECYQCMMSMLDYNLTSKDTALRSSESIVVDGAVIASATKTHAGTDINQDNLMNISLDLRLGSLSVELFDDSTARICKVTARETVISSLMDARSAVMTTDITLVGLDVVNSEELKFFTRDSEAAAGEGLFKLVHVAKGGDNSSEIDIHVNGPRIRVQPGLINALMGWTGVERKEAEAVIDGGSTISKQTIKFVSSGCRLELLQKVNEGETANGSTIEMGGDLRVTYTMERGSSHRSNSAHVQAKNLEVIKVGFDDKGKVQIVEPVGFELQYQKTETEGSLDEAKRDETKLNFCSDVGMDVKLSMRDLVAVGRVLESLGEIGEEKEQNWGEGEQCELERLVRELEGGRMIEAMEDDNQSLDSSSSGASSRTTSTNSLASFATGYMEQLKADQKRMEGPGVQVFDFNATVPNVTLTFIDDVRVPTPVFKAELGQLIVGGDVRNLVEGGQGWNGVLHVDGEIRGESWGGEGWKNVLVKPWRVTLTGSRQENRNRTGVEKDKEESGKEEVGKMITKIGFDAGTFLCVVDDTLLRNISGAIEGWNSLVETGEVEEAKAYEINNETGVVVDVNKKTERGEGGEEAMASFKLGPGERKGFSYEQRRGKGLGVRRLYGTDVIEVRGLEVSVEGGRVMAIDNVDVAKMHVFQGDSGTIIVSVEKTVGKMGPFTRVTIRNLAVMRNKCRWVEFDLGLKAGGREEEGGVIAARGALGVKRSFLRSLEPSAGAEGGPPNVTLLLKPRTKDGELVGYIRIPHVDSIADMDDVEIPVLCKRDGEGHERSGSSMVVTVVFKRISFVRGISGVDFYLYPRVVIRNSLDLTAGIRTPMPHTYSARMSLLSEMDYHAVESGSTVECYTNGRGIAVSIRNDMEIVVGTDTGWVEGEWIDLDIEGTMGKRASIAGRASFADEEDEGLEMSGLVDDTFELPLVGGGGGESSLK